CQQYNIYSSF
nr:immunoglobulin light chain junction region [Homo sapiens]